jgi:Zn-dependent protease with chaperone function
VNASLYSEKCEREFRKTVFLAAIVLFLPAVIFVLKADYYLSVIFDSHIVLHFCHFLKTVIPSIFNMIFLVAAIAFILFIPTGFLKSIFHLFRGLTFPPFLKPLLSDIPKRVNEDRRQVMDYEVVEIDSHIPFALAGGIIDKKIIVSKSLRKLLNPEEYDAVLMHEAGHLEMNHPFKRILVSSILSALCIILSRKDLSKRFRTLTELSADEFAVKMGAKPAILAGAIVKAAKGDRLVEETSIAGFTDSQVRERIHALLGIEGKRRRRTGGKDRIPSRILKTVPTVLFLIFLIQPFLYRPDSTYCIKHHEGIAWQSRTSRMISVCTEINCEQCDNCSPAHREHNKTRS